MKPPPQVSLRAEHAKALLACVGKLGKAIALSFDDPKTSQGPRWNVPLDDASVLDVVACHYYREGKADSADAAVRARFFGAEVRPESSFVADIAAISAETRAARADARLRDETRRVVLDGIRERDIVPLLDWIRKNAKATGTAHAAGRLFPFFSDWKDDSEKATSDAPNGTGKEKEKEKDGSRDGSGLLFGYPGYSPTMSVELELYARRAAIGEALERGDAVEAARRARASLELLSRASSPVLGHRSAFHFERLARLLQSAPFATGPGALARPESACQEKALAAKAGKNGEWWRDLADRFERAFRVSEFEPRESPLLVAANAGCVSMPSLAKLASALAKARTSDERTTLKDFRETEGDDEKNNVAALPVELPLPPERFAFGSTFACPVRRDAVFDPDEPIVMLPCGVLISKGGIDVLTGSRPANATFKCINCSRETDLSECMRVFF